MAYISFVDSLKTAVLTPVRNAIDAGADAGVIDIYSGARPTDANTAIGAQVRLGTLTFADPCSSAPGSLGVALTMGNITQDASADATGTASWARVYSYTAAGNVRTTVMDIDITTTGGGGTMQMNTTNIVAGGPILISSFVLSVA